MRLKVALWIGAVLTTLGVADGSAQGSHCGACSYPTSSCCPDQCCMPRVRTRVCYQTIVENRTKVCYRPVYHTVLKECRYTTSRPVYEQHYRECRYTVCRPV